MEGERLFGRVKVFHHKTRSGCLTCRRRRLKCGEEKPVCVRCYSTGRKCHAYEPVLSREAASKQHGKQLIWLTPNQYRSNTEAQLLASWLKYTAPMVSLFSGSNELWTVIIPRASWQYYEVRQMVLAMAAFDKICLSGESDTLVVHGQFDKVLKYYNKAIVGLTSGQPALENILLSSLLGSTIEFIRTCYDESYSHIQCAQRIVKEFRSKSTKALDPDLDRVIELVEAVHWDLQYEDFKTWERNGKSLEGLPKIDNLEDARQGLKGILELINVPDPDIDTVNATQAMIEKWRASFELYKYRPGTESLGRKRSVYLFHNMIGCLIDMKRRRSLGLPNVRQLECIVQDSEDVLEFNNLYEFQQGVRALLEYVVKQADAESTHAKKACKLVERLNKRFPVLV